MEKIDEMDFIHGHSFFEGIPLLKDNKSRHSQKAEHRFPLRRV